MNINEKIMQILNSAIVNGSNGRYFDINDTKNQSIFDQINKENIESFDVNKDGILDEKEYYTLGLNLYDKADIKISRDHKGYTTVTSECTRTDGSIEKKKYILDKQDRVLSYECQVQKDNEMIHKSNIKRDPNTGEEKLYCEEYDQDNNKKYITKSIKTKNKFCEKRVVYDKKSNLTTVYTTEVKYDENGNVISNEEYKREYDNPGFFEEIYQKLYEGYDDWKLDL